MRFVGSLLTFVVSVIGCYIVVVGVARDNGASTGQMAISLGAGLCLWAVSPSGLSSLLRVGWKEEK